MLFNSIEFLYFFLIVTVTFFVLPHKVRWLLLLLASCYFYMVFRPEYILILFFTIIIDYFVGIKLEKIQDKSWKKKFLIISIIANIGILVFFKYYNFINTNITEVLDLFSLKNKLPYLNIVLPIGLSFHTFQALSYTIEVYRGNHKAERHFGIYALYVMFYPQLVAGPIERPQNILHQLHEKKSFIPTNAILGINLIVFGLFKKLVIADRLAIYVNQVFSSISDASSVSVIIAIAFFSFQIYCDFSGYSDIARGTAKFMGYELMINFNRPYSARSINEFWSKWHISLSSWFRDYLYIPLGGNRGKKIFWYRNLFIVFLISGLWHGANWTFVIWGGLHAIYLISSHLLKDFGFHGTKIKIHNSIKPLIGFLNVIFVFILVSFAWIFFRASSINQAIEVINKILHFDYSFNLIQLSAELGPLNLIISFFVIVLLLFSEKIFERLKINNSLAFNIVYIFLILILGMNGKTEFIYFQF